MRIINASFWRELFKKTEYSPFLHYLLIPSSPKSVLEIQVTKTTLTSRSGWFWLPVFPVSIICKLETSRKCKIDELFSIHYISKESPLQRSHFLAFWRLNHIYRYLS